MWNESDDQSSGTFTDGVQQATRSVTGRRSWSALGKKRMRSNDWGVDGGHLFCYNHIVLAPHGSHELVAYLALAESLEETKRYGTLAT